MTEKKECFWCKRKYFVNDPEFDSEKRICSFCAEELERDNPYNYGLVHEDENEQKETD